MISAAVRKIMTGAVLRLANEEKIEPSRLSIVIFTRNEELIPEYYYTVDDTPKVENGEIVLLRFKQDILGKKIDMMQQEALAAQFLSSKFAYFANAHEEDGFSVFNMDLLIKPKTNGAEDFNVLLCHDKKFVKNYTLEDIFEIG